MALIEYSLVSTANSGAYVANPVAGSPIIGDGSWHHIVGMVDRAAQVASVYVDGTLAGSWTIVGLGTLEYSNSIAIGEDPTGNYGSATFDLDDLGIWRRVLTDYDVRALYIVGNTYGRSFDTVAPPEIRLQIRWSGTNLEVLWPNGTLESANSLQGPWTPVSGANPPSYKATPSGVATFYRARQ